MLKFLVGLKRRFLFFVIFFLYLLTCASFPAYSQQELTSPKTDEEILSEQAQPLKPPAQIFHYRPEYPPPFLHYPFLVNFRNVIIPGKVKLDDNTLNLIYECQLDNGIKNFTTMASFLLNESQKAIQRGQPYEAIRFAKEAKKMAPEFPQPYWALAQAYGAESKFRLFRILEQYFQGDLIAVKNFRSLMLLSCNIHFILSLAFFFTISTFAIIMLFKYFSLLAKDCGDFFFQKTYALPGFLWAGIVVIVPIILGIGPILVACYWMVILVIYVGKKEKQTIWIFSLLLILSPWCFRNFASMILANQEGLLDLLHRANYEDWSPETEKKLKVYLRTHPRDSGVLLSLGLIKKRQGYLEEAKRYYTTLLEIQPGSEVVMSNLASVYFAQGKLEPAEETFQRSISLNNQKASFHYNLYWTYLERYKFLEARKREELSIARRLDPVLIDYQKNIYSPTIPNRIIIDETLTLKEFWSRAFQGSEEREILASSLWCLFYKGIPYGYGVFFFILLSLLISVFLYRDTAKKISTRCNQCGKPMKKRVRLNELSQGCKAPELCSHCVSIYIQRTKLDQDIKDSKIEQIKRHQKRQTFIWKLLTYALPGGGHIWIGLTGLGTLYLFIFFCFVLKIIFWNGVIKDPFFLAYPLSFFKVIFFSFVLFFFYCLSIKQSYLKKEIADKTFVQILEAFRRRSQNEKDQIEGRAIISCPKEETPWP